MTLNFSNPEEHDLRPRITVFGVGGAGGNAVNNMIQKALDGVDFVVANTDAQALQQSQSEARIQLGAKITEGLGAGARATVGAAAAEESIETIVDQLAGAHMCFITAGMGGGTGTGAAPIIAQAARELGILTVGVVTKPFQFEGAKRMRQAEEGVEALQKMVDTLIIIPNQNLFRLANENTTFTEAFALADDVLYQGVKGVTDLMVRPGLINLDFADVRAVMDEMGKAMMGTGEASGEDRAIQAAEKAIANPLLDEISLKGARGVLINITGSSDLTLFELDEAANRIREEVDPDANIIVGSTLDPEMDGMMRVSVVATGIDASTSASEQPAPRRKLSEPLRETISLEAPVEAHTHEIARSEAPLITEAMEPVNAQEEAQPAPEIREPSLFGQFEQSIAPSPHPIETNYSDTNAGTAEANANAPTEDALAKLKAAVQARKAMSVEPSLPARPAMASETPQQQPAQEPPRSRMGLGSLIGRMTGQPASEIEEEAAKPLAAAPRPKFSIDEAYEAASPERSEIPAFLRRQAN